ncbi:hypothetical protein [Methanospirillum sp.]|uniref:hypothetical protein n=1 Tax=Methanospirillum sp. TaxID=45200 RepID=UPI00359FAE43
MASVSSGVIALGIIVMIGSLFCTVYADEEIYPGGMVVPKFDSSMIGTMQNAEKFDASEIATMQNAEKFDASEIATMQNAGKFNASEIATMQNVVSTVPLPSGVTV